MIVFKMPIFILRHKMPQSSCKTALRSLFLFLLLTLMLAAHGAPQPAPAWLVEVKHRQLGSYRVYLARDAIKMVNLSAGYQVLSKAPDWDIITFRSDDKMLNRVKRASYYRGNNYVPVDDKPNSSRIRQVAIAYVDKLKAGIFSNGYEDFWLIESLGLSREVCAVPQVEFSTKPLAGWLVRYTVALSGHEVPDKTRPEFDSHDGKHIFVVTRSIKSVPYNSADFATPVGYKYEANREHLLTSNQSKAGADQILEELGLGQKLGSERK